jgi:hypothetical protein
MLFSYETFILQVGIFFLVYVMSRLAFAAVAAAAAATTTTAATTATTTTADNTTTATTTTAAAASTTTITTTTHVLGYDFPRAVSSLSSSSLWELAYIAQLFSVKACYSVAMS